ncbi:MAG: hypothetical protein OHM56_10080 [Spiroplasma phoeniceum]|nr:MAG: hypothetical protein OHM56_10080 [Spiroplasma phoeniceum]
MEEQKIKISASTVYCYMKILQICSEVRIKHFNNMLYEHKNTPIYLKVILILIQWIKNDQLILK